MEKYEIAVNHFIKEMKYLENSHVLGIIVYGSFTTGYNHAKSDIDINIIFDDSTDKIYRGVKDSMGFKVEYFEKPIKDIYLSVDNDFLVNENAYYTIIGRGNVIYDRSGEIAVLKEYILNKYRKEMPSLSGDDAKEMAVILDNRLIRLQSMLDNNRVDFLSYYYLFIEKVRKFYSRICGCSNIPTDKVLRIYSDSKYCESFGKKIPDQEFIDKYFNAISNNGTNEEKMAIARDLYNYAIRDLDFNPNNYRILIKSRNNILNRNHN